MSLSKEVLHSEELAAVLKELQNNLESNGGLLPGQFTDEDVTLLYELAYNLYQAEEFAKASEIFQRLVIAKPFEPKYWQAYASSLQMQKLYRESLTPWSMWCLIESKNPIPHFHAAEALFSLGEIQEGLQALKAAENRDSDGALKDKIASLRLAWETKND